MSKYHNPLNEFRTYSYYHVLAIADSVESATLYGEADNNSEVLLNTRTVGRTTASSINGGNVVILVNGPIDAHYVISQLSWQTTVSTPGTDNVDNFTSMEGEGSLTIEESKGVKFFNNIKDAYAALAADPTGCVWTIRTIFVGHPKNGGPPEYISNIKPLIFNIINIEADFSNKGGIYTISFVPINNGASKLSQIRNVTETLSINLEEDNTLPNAIRLLNDNINRRYKEYYDKIEPTIREGGAEPKEVSYKIILHDDYDETYEINDVQPQNSQEGLEGSGALLNFGKDLHIENAIKKIMKSSKKVKEDATGKYGEKITYKIRSVLNSSKEKHEVLYFIDRYVLPFDDILKEAASGKYSAAVAANTIEFDYIFSGRNTDIIDFSMKFEQGMSFFQALINSNNLGGQEAMMNSNTEANNVASNKNAVQVNNPKAGDGKQQIPNPKMPVFFSTTVKHPSSKNTTTPKESSEFQAILSRHAAIENINAKVKIHGNPSLMNSTTKLPNDYVDSGIRGAGEDAVLPNWERIPALAKINVYMPESSDDDFGPKEKFWYDGNYHIFSITNDFNGGKFTQVLDMISLPTADPTTETKLEEVNEENANATGGAGGGGGGGIGNANKTPVGEILNHNKTKNNTNLKQ